MNRTGPDDCELPPPARTSTSRSGVDGMKTANGTSWDGREPLAPSESAGTASPDERPPPPSDVGCWDTRRCIRADGSGWLERSRSLKNQHPQQVPQKGATIGTLRTPRGHDSPSLAELPFTVVVGAFSIIVVDVPRLVQLGPVTLWGAITLLVAVLIILLLPGYAMGALRPLSVGETEAARTRIPWTMWCFVAYVSISLVIVAANGDTGSETIQNACVYLIFAGAIAIAADARSFTLLLYGWAIMRNASVVFAYLALAVSIQGLVLSTSVADNSRFLFGPRSMTIIGLIALAIVIPGIPSNNWVRFAPFAMVTAMALSLSRTGTAIGFALLVFLVLRGRGAARAKPAGRLFKATVMLLVVMVSAYLLVILYAPFRDRFLGGDKGLTLGGVTISTQGRAKLWELVWSRSYDNWLLGHGVGSASKLVNEYVPGLGHPHNDYLRLYFDFGVVGVALFIAGYITLIWRILRNARRSDHPLHWAAFIALVAIALVAITDNPFAYPFVMLPLGSLVGLSLGLTRFYPADRGRAAGAKKLESPAEGSNLIAAREARP